MGVDKSFSLCNSALKKKGPIKIELLHDPVISFLSIYPKEVKSTYQRDTCTPGFFYVGGGTRV
jgi:hypothetical protein